MFTSYACVQTAHHKHKSVHSYARTCARLFTIIKARREDFSGGVVRTQHHSAATAQIIQIYARVPELNTVHICAHYYCLERRVCVMRTQCISVFYYMVYTLLFYGMHTHNSRLIGPVDIINGLALGAHPYRAHLNDASVYLHTHSNARRDARVYTTSHMCVCCACDYMLYLNCCKRPSNHFGEPIASGVH